ncbi:MAG TPA: hypothetical protein VMV68_10480 [Spirochaetia bacterium]|nr:hypothetical protein [Spirochaetia bacterium]
MTITLRNNVLRLSLLLTILLLLGFFVLIGLLYLPPQSLGQLRAVLKVDGAITPLLSLVESLFLVAFSVAAGILLQIFFRKTVSSEMFFFIFFVISLSLEAVRAGQLYIQIVDLPPYYGVVLTRVAYFGRFFGLFCLFVSGLYATGIDYQRFEVVLGISLLIAFTLAFTIPVNSQPPAERLVNGIGGADQILAAFFALELFSVLNFVLASTLKRSRNHLFMAAGLLLVVAGVDLLYFTASLAPAIAGAVLLAAGSFVFGNRTHEVYLWS